MGAVTVAVLTGDPWYEQVGIKNTVWGDWVGVAVMSPVNVGRQQAVASGIRPERTEQDLCMALEPSLAKPLDGLS